MDLTGVPYLYRFPVLTPPYTRYYPQTDRSLQMARMAGLEPATPALTVRCSTIELHPNMAGAPQRNLPCGGFGNLSASDSRRGTRGNRATATGGLRLVRRSHPC